MHVTAWSIRQSGLEGEHVVTLGVVKKSTDDELNNESPLVNVVASNDDNKVSIISAQSLCFISDKIVYDNFGSFICGIILLYPFFVYSIGVGSFINYSFLLSSTSAFGDALPNKTWEKSLAWTFACFGLSVFVARRFVLITHFLLKFSEIFLHFSRILQLFRACGLFLEIKFFQHSQIFYILFHFTLLALKLLFRAWILVL